MQSSTLFKHLCIWQRVLFILINITQHYTARQNSAYARLKKLKALSAHLQYFRNTANQWQILVHTNKFLCMQGFYACKFFQIKESHAHIQYVLQHNIHETSVLVVCESLFPSTFIHLELNMWVTRSSGAESHETMTLNRRSAIHKTPASVGMLNIAVFICHYCTPQSMSHEPENFISIQPAAALSPALGARHALHTFARRKFDSHFCTIWEPPTELLMPGWK